MTIQRAIVKGLIADLVQTRNMFTCDVVESGGDTYQILWGAYLQAIWDELEPLISTGTATISYELQNYSAGSWVTFDEVAFVNTGSDINQAAANFISLVLLGKGAGLRKVGRKFFGGLTENTIQVNSLAVGFAAQAALLLAAYITPFTGLGGGTITPGIVDSGGTFRAFVGGVVSSFLGTMRRRKPGLGI